ncbi:hypothetical protein L2E82_43851 [Cichorium intybus]|uniref:Uncharacterized protein n=1 Tax=Cichorium intybus TaxID=13427 RepID=A0ACB8ZQ97_CICIN|nr:hypothetical protein L2E82_43851 [Cichorium intybus]
MEERSGVIGDVAVVAILSIIHQQRPWGRGWRTLEGWKRCEDCRRRCLLSIVSADDHSFLVIPVEPRCYKYRWWRGCRRIWELWERGERLKRKKRRCAIKMATSRKPPFLTIRCDFR